MTDHAGLLRQIRQDARPYVEQALDLAEVFTGFRKLASENGLDWGVIKALIKAEVQDEKEGGSLKVDRIIEKADFASAYADMLGIGTSKMNEKSFSSETICEALARAGLTLEQINPSTGELIEEPVSPHDLLGKVAVPRNPGGSHEVAPDSDSDTSLEKLDCRPKPSGAGTGSDIEAAAPIPQRVALTSDAAPALGDSPLVATEVGASIPDLPTFLDRRSAA